MAKRRGGAIIQTRAASFTIKFSIPKGAKNQSAKIWKISIQ